MAVCWTRTGSAIALSVSLSLSRNACRSSLACSASSARLRSVMSRTVARIPPPRGLRTGWRRSLRPTATTHPCASRGARVAGSGPGCARAPRTLPRSGDGPRGASARRGRAPRTLPACSRRPLGGGVGIDDPTPAVAYGDHLRDAVQQGASGSPSRLFRHAFSLRPGELRPRHTRRKPSRPPELMLFLGLWRPRPADFAPPKPPRDVFAPLGP
jgi:hypothetical protein